MKKIKIGMMLLLIVCMAFGAELETIVLKGKEKVEDKVQLAPGQRVQVMLESNPTTGYDWEFLLTLSDSVIVENDEFRPCNEKLCGAGGMRVVTLKGVKKGNGKLLGFYRRQWEKFDTAKDQRYLLNFSVEEK